MKMKINGNIAQYSDIDGASDFIGELRSVKAPVVVLFADNLSELSDSESEILKNCPALTVIAGENLSAISNNILSKFDLRITETPIPITNTDGADNPECAALCGENSAYKYSRGDDIGNDFFTILSDSGDFCEKTVQYLDSLAKEKDEFQLYALAACFRAARSASTEDVFEQESLQFYRLMQRKSKEAQNGLQ